ncbi:MAG: hypothetical protein QOD98_209 [Nocardioidaceae bacterium]|jgi:hypothetical protein|nr:hypothetical protein [Nocardioidaceae bacterium]
MKLLGRRDGAAVTATYAAVLDGVHLWLDVDGPVAVREADAKAVTELGDHPYDLGGLTGSAYDVLVGKHPVSLAAPPEQPLTKTPLAPDGTTQWEVVRLDDGRLQLARRSVPPTAELDAVDVLGDRVHLRIRPPGEVEPGFHLLLLDTDDQVLASLPATAHEGLVETLIAVDDLPAGYFGVLRLAVGTDSAWVRVRRHSNDLADPNHAVLLPELYAELAPDQARARLRWNPDGLLALRSIDPDEQL